MNRVETAIRSEPAFDSAQSHEEKCRIAGHANVEHSVERLYSKSESLAALISSGDVMCIGAEYSVETGIVSWL